MNNFKERNEYFARAMTDAQVSYIEAERAACDLEAENAQLRELVNILLFCANKERVVGCDGCAINGADMHATVPEWLFCDSMVERLRTLGFEVAP